MTGGGEAVHLNSQITEGALELLPVINVVEQLKAVCLNQGLVHVREALSDDLHQVVDDELLVGGIAVRVAIVILDWRLNLRVFRQFYHLLEDLAL